MGLKLVCASFLPETHALLNTQVRPRIGLLHCDKGSVLYYPCYKISIYSSWRVFTRTQRKKFWHDFTGAVFPCRKNKVFLPNFGLAPSVYVLRQVFVVSCSYRWHFRNNQLDSTTQNRYVSQRNSPRQMLLCFAPLLLLVYKKNKKTTNQQ